MGWLFITGMSRKDLIEDRIKPFEDERVKQETLAWTTRGNVLWQVREVTIKQPVPHVERFIECDLLQYSKQCEGWGYKDMDESMHPYYYSCPLKYLEMVPTSNPGTCEKWREGVVANAAKVRENAKATRARKKARKGSTFENTWFSS